MGLLDEHVVNAVVVARPVCEFISKFQVKLEKMMKMSHFADILEYIFLK